jgi:DNA-binding beta-propeller fold protein YncE
VFDKEGSFLFKFGSYNNDKDQICSPIYLQINQTNGDIIVTDTNNRVQIFDQNGTLKLSFGSYDIFRGTRGVAVDDEFNIYISDYYHNYIQVFDDKGIFKYRLYSEKKSHYDGFLRISWIAIDIKQNHIVAVDHANCQIQTFNKQGKNLFTSNYRGTSDGKLYHPTGITISEEGLITVADSDNHRVQIFDTQGKYLLKIESNDFDNRLSDPYDVAFDQNINLYVTDYDNNRIKVYSPNF